MVDPGATLDIVGGQLNTGGLIDNGTINVDGDPPVLVITGPATTGSTGTITAHDGSMMFESGSLANAGTLTAGEGGTMLIDESGINSGLIQAIDGGVVTIESGTIVNKDGLITALGAAASIVLADAAVAGGTIEARHDGVVDP
jgi:hypothetical protein